MTRYSVCIATYNGEKYIREQLASILPQLGEDDEIIVSDDSSTDDTLTVLKQLADPRIKIYPHQTFHSPIFNFEHALKEVRGDIVFLSDQDDIWLPDKVNVVAKAFEEHGCDIVVSDAVIVDDRLGTLHESFFEFYKSRPGLLKNIYRNRYLGCTMAVKKRILEKALPFPRNIAMHDMWIGLIGELFGKTVFIDDKLILYRRHSNTLTTGKHASIGRMLRWRICLVADLLIRYLQTRNCRATPSGNMVIF